MSASGPHDGVPLPEWLRRELEAAPAPSAEELERYDYMRPAFMEALAEARQARQRAAPQPGQSPVQAVFSLAGELLWWARDVLTRWEPATGALAARSVAQARRRPGPVARVAATVGERRIEVATYRAGGVTEVEVNLVSAADGRELRPYTVTVYDMEGRLIHEPVPVALHGQAPRFPKPEPGVYVFAVSWKGGKGALEIKFASNT